MSTMEIEDHEDLVSEGSAGDDDMDVGSGASASESGDDGDEEDDSDILSRPSKSKKPKKRRSLDSNNSKPALTPKQISKLNEAESTYHSNLYRFQIQEVLAEVSVKSKVRVKILEWFEGFKNHVNTLKRSKAVPLNSYNSFLGDIQLPFPDGFIPKAPDSSTFQWTRPDSIVPVGSWSIDTPLAKLSSFDVAVEMPSTLFHKSDLRNHVYHFKRAVYAAYLAKKLQNCGDEIRFTCSDGDPLRPILQIYIKSKTILNVQIHFILPKDFSKFARVRLEPFKNNIRGDYFLSTALEREGDEAGPRTPCYNHSILHDLLFTSNQEFIKDALANSQPVCDAIKLLKVWLTQRSLNKGFGSFSNFIMTMFVIYLYQNKKINSMMSSYQIIRVVFVNLMQSDWVTGRISLEGSPDAASLDKWQTAHEVLFLDSTGQLNFTANMTRSTFNRIKYEAKLAIENLNSGTTGGFQFLFISKSPFFLNFDNVLRLKITEKLLNRFKSDEKWRELYLNFSGFPIPVAVRIITPLIEKCLGNRAKMLDHELTPPPEWEITQKSTTESAVNFGIIINRDTAFKLIEKCESEDPGIAKSFKEFWGEKSQLRRFMDGTMMESVSFENGDTDRVLFQMLSYILHRHLEISLSPKNEDYLDAQLERLLEPELFMLKFVETAKRVSDPKGPRKKKMRYSLPQKEKLPPVPSQPVALDEVTTLASKSFDALSKTLRQLEGLPLDITSVQGTSAVLRFSNIYPTPPQRFAPSAILSEVMGTYLRIKEPEEGTVSKVPRNIEPIGVVVQLEASGKWPDDIEAIERLKCAFLIRIGQLLEEQFGLTVQFFPRYLYVLKDGFIFRIRLTYYREITLLKQLRGEDGILRTRDNPESLALERDTLILPQVTSTLHALNRQFGAFGRTCRLAKRWIASHLLLGSQDQDINIHHHDVRFTEESIELLVASLFLQHAPFLSPPNSAQIGFIRFLNLLGTTDWKSTPFILNFNGKLSKADIEKLDSEFVRRRETLPLLFIATPEDRLGSVWTKHLSTAILLRAQVLAKYAIDSLLEDLKENKDGEDHASLKWKKLFRSSIEVFDAVIWIKKEMIARKAQAVNSFNFKMRFQEYSKMNEEHMPIVDFDPVRSYYQELRETFGHLCNFVSDVYGGNFIALAWKPEALNPRDFEVSQVRGRKLAKDGISLILDVDALLEEMEFMGDGIVDHVEVKRKTSV